VADHGRGTIEKSIDHAVSRNKLDSGAFSIENEPIRLGIRGYHLAGFFDGHGRYAAQGGIFVRQFLVAESAVNLLKQGVNLQVKNYASRVAQGRRPETNEGGVHKTPVISTINIPSK
jgi:hypothetical protein